MKSVDHARAAQLSRDGLLRERSWDPLPAQSLTTLRWDGAARARVFVQHAGGGQAFPPPWMV